MAKEPAAKKPVLHMIAGPNGAGKTTLYRTELQGRHPSLPFVNADELALERFGHAAETVEEAKEGQRLAEQMRRELMARGVSFVGETTMSHPSKNVLLDDARAGGYRVFLYHVNVRDADLAVARVAARVEQGGHPVPEDRTRARYVRNQALIREAVLNADRAWVYDNSQWESFHRMALVFREGKVQTLGENVPGWARTLYHEELKDFPLEQLNAPAHSFDQARAFASVVLGEQARTYVARGGGSYRGAIVGETSLHVLQQVGPATAIAHFRNRLSEQVRAGEKIHIVYDTAGKNGAVSRLQTPPVRGTDADAAMARAFREERQETALKQFPALANAYAHVRVFEAAMRSHGHSATGDQVDAVRERVARQIEDGRPLRAVAVVQDRSEPEQEPSQ